MFVLGGVCLGFMKWKESSVKKRKAAAIAEPPSDLGGINNISDVAE
jgi:hypothetical protein